jgi:hypothetical protein
MKPRIQYAKAADGVSIAVTRLGLLYFSPSAVPPHR